MLRATRRNFIHAGLTLVGAASLTAKSATARLTHGSAYYEGLIASRARQMTTTQDATFKYGMGRSAHFATENLSSVRVAFSVPNSGFVSFAASIEYPAGTFTQLKFSGATPFTGVPSFPLLTDYATVSIPAGATFWVRSFTNAGLIYYNAWQNSFLGEVTNLSATAISDLTMGGTIANSGAFSLPPIAVLGITKNPSVIIVGDSIAFGNGDSEDTSASVTGYNAKIGIIARSLGNVPFLNTAQNGLTANGYSNDQALWSKGSHLISELGTNDLFGSGATAAQLEGYLALIFARKGSQQRVYQTTLLPRTQSSDGWTTVGGQSQNNASGETQREAFNSALRNGTTGLGLTGFFDTASILETGLNSGLWIVSPSPPYTFDGIHPTAAFGYPLVASSGVIPIPTYP